MGVPPFIYDKYVVLNNDTGNFSNVSINFDELDLGSLTHL